MKEYTYDTLMSTLEGYKGGQTAKIFPKLSVYNFDGIKGVTVTPFKLGMIATFFDEVVGIDIKDYIPDSIIEILNDLEVTSEDAINEIDESRGLTLLKLSEGYQLDFALQYAGEVEFNDAINISDFYIAFTITNGNVSATISSGNIHFKVGDEAAPKPLNLRLTAKIPSWIFAAELDFNSEGNEQEHKNQAEKYLGDLKKEGASIEVEEIRFLAALRMHNYSLHLSVNNVLDVHDKFTVKRFQADIDYRGGTTGGYSIMAYTGIEIGFENDPLEITLIARYESVVGDKKWLFSGSLARPITFEAMITDLCQLFGQNNPFHLPDVISNTIIEKLELSFEGATSAGGGNEKDYHFAIGLSIPVQGNNLQLEINADYSKKGPGYELDLKGTASIAGRQFTIEFKKKSDSQATGPLANASLLELKYVSDGDKINLTELLADITDDSDITDALPDVSVKLDEVLFAVLKEGDTNKYLFGIELEVPIDFDFGKLPAVGSMLSSQGKFGIQSFKFFLASQPFYEEEVLFFPAVDQAFIMGNLPAQPVAVNVQPTVPQRVTVLTKGANFRAILNLGSMQKTIPPPPRNILPPPAFTSAVIPTGGNNGSAGGSNGSTGGSTLPARKTSTAADGQASWMSIEKSIGPVTIARVGAAYKDGKLWFFLSGSFSLASFAVSLDGLGIGAPIKDFSVDKIDVSLTGMGIDIQKGTLSIAATFLRLHYPESTSITDGHTIAAYDEFNGIVQVAFPPFSLTGMGSYALYDGHPSLFLFVAIGFPITVDPSLIIEGMSLGFGIHRDFIAPEMKDILSFPLIQASVTPPPPMDIDKMVESLHHYFPPTVGQYFVVAGIKFKAFGLVDTLALLAVKFGREFEVDLIGVSSILLPGGFIELGWMARFIPDKGEFFIGGELTNRSFILAPMAQLTGGFAVAFWTNGTHKGDFVVSVGGYHPQYKKPEHYPDHISRLGISFKLGSILTIKGGMYFAVTPQAIMMGGFLNATLKRDNLEGYLNMTLDAMIWYQPFHYDALISVDAGVKVDIPAALFTIHINLHLHLDVHIWGPEFSGIAYLDVGVKTFSVPFGTESSTKALPVGWDVFKGKFLQIKDKDGNPKDNVCSAVITKGMIRKVKKADNSEIYVVNPKELEIEAKTIVPITEKIEGAENTENIGRFGITPMGIKRYKAHFTTTITKDVESVAHTENHSLTHTEITIQTKNVTERRTIDIVEDKIIEKTTTFKEILPRNFFKNSSLFSSVPAAIWGTDGLVSADLSSSDKSLLKNALTGVLITPATDTESGETHEMDKEQLAYNTDEIELAKAALTHYSKVESGEFRAGGLHNSFPEFTGLTEATAIDRTKLLHDPIIVSLNN